MKTWLWELWTQTAEQPNHAWDVIAITAYKLLPMQERELTFTLLSGGCFFFFLHELKYFNSTKAHRNFSIKEKEEEAADKAE